MKKKFKVAIRIVLVVLIGIITLGVAEKNNLFNIKSWGQEEYFVQITKDGEKVSENPYPYLYQTIAYNKDGKGITVDFYANKNLRVGAFLNIDTISQSENKSNSIASYEEVQENELQEKVKEKLLKKMIQEGVS